MGIVSFTDFSIKSTKSTNSQNKGWIFLENLVETEKRTESKVLWSLKSYGPHVDGSAGIGRTSFDIASSCPAKPHVILSHCSCGWGLFIGQHFIWVEEDIGRPTLPTKTDFLFGMFTKWTPIHFKFRSKLNTNSLWIARTWDRTEVLNCYYMCEYVCVCVSVVHHHQHTSGLLVWPAFPVAISIERENPLGHGRKEKWWMLGKEMAKMEWKHSKWCVSGVCLSVLRTKWDDVHNSPEMKVEMTESCNGKNAGCCLYIKDVKENFLIGGKFI